jgi:acetolactate synthase regulatory subunit
VWQQVLDTLRQEFEITDDQEWSIISDQLGKVHDAATASVRGWALLGGDTTPSPEDEALQQAIDSNAPASQLKAAIAKVMDSRKAKLAKLQKAQDDLRQLLTIRQEAIACSLGIL